MAIIPHSIRFVNAGKEKSEKIFACPTTSFIELLPPFAVTLFMANRQTVLAHFPWLVQGWYLLK